MDFISWLDAEEGRGRLTALASHFGLTQSAVSQWRVNGVPPGRMKAVRDFTGGVVTLEEMLPDPEQVTDAKAA
jgi:DNA-binding transcriptional regulator YdaS (Cro superfamily)